MDEASVYSSILISDGKQTNKNDKRAESSAQVKDGQYGAYISLAYILYASWTTFEPSFN